MLARLINFTYLYNMKKLLLLFVTVIALSSCEQDIEPLKSPKASTNVVLLEAEKDTVPILIKDNTVYIFNEEGLVEYKVNSIDPIDTFGAGVLVIGDIVLFFVVFFGMMIDTY